MKRSLRVVQRICLYGSVLVVLVALGLVYWPTPYRYWTGGQGYWHYRTNRLTGETQEWVREQWQPLHKA